VAGASVLLLCTMKGSSAGVTCCILHATIFAMPDYAWLAALITHCRTTCSAAHNQNKKVMTTLCA
jgi:hypothetical protein